MNEQEHMLRYQIVGFPDGTIPLHAFRHRFTLPEWEASPPEDWPLMQLISSTDSRLVTFDAGDYPTAQLQQSLAYLVTRVDGQEPAGPDPLAITSP